MPTTFQAFKYRIYPTDEGYLRFDVGPHKKSNSRSRIDVCKSLR